MYPGVRKERWEREERFEYFVGAGKENFSLSAFLKVTVNVMSRSSSFLKKKLD